MESNNDQGRTPSANDQQYTSEQLDTKYKPLHIEDSPQISCKHIQIERFVTLLNGDIILSPPNTLVDINVLFSVVKETPVERLPNDDATESTEYYYASLGFFLQKTTINQPYFSSLL